MTICSINFRISVSWWQWPSSLFIIILRCLCLFGAYLVVILEEHNTCVTHSTMLSAT